MLMLMQKHRGFGANPRSQEKKTDQLRLYTEAGFFGILNHPSTHAIYSTQEVAH
jgi:hypothetical protein